jgi:7-cyano-7-deazaguanine synthase in queuosine biosynthesis
MKAVRYVGEKGCRDARYTAALEEQDTTVIDTLRGGNVTLRFRRDGRPLRVDLSPLSRDLVDVAVMAYITDEMERRALAPDGWTRRHEFVVPVRDPALWSRVTPGLEGALRRVSGDRFDFSWLARSAIAVPNHRATLPRRFDAVCLFSGGIDSLMGAHQLLAAGKKVILVGHQADPTTAAAQTELARQLASMFPGAVTLVQCRVARAMSERSRRHLPIKCEDTHRCRSFLFLSLATTIAASASVGEVYIPENGLIALNAPLQPSRLGTLSTRTAHPLFLCGFADFAAAVGLFKAKLQNPFLYQSKTDMLRTLPAPLVPLVVRSVSCSRPSRFQDHGVRHCGYCVPCIYRRAAMMECGLDQADDYAFDAFRDLHNLRPHQRVDFRALVQFAQMSVNASEWALGCVW